MPLKLFPRAKQKFCNTNYKFILTLHVPIPIYLNLLHFSGFSRKYQIKTLHASPPPHIQSEIRSLVGFKTATLGPTWQ